MYYEHFHDFDWKFRKHQCSCDEKNLINRWDKDEHESANILVPLYRNRLVANGKTNAFVDYRN